MVLFQDFTAAISLRIWLDALPYTPNINTYIETSRSHRHLLRRWPLGLQFILVEALLQQPTQAGHALHPVEEGRVLGRVLVTLHDNRQLITQSIILLKYSE